MAEIYSQGPLYGVGDDAPILSSKRMPYIIEAMLDYWWLSACVFTLILSASILYIFTQPKAYTAAALLQLYRDDPAVMGSATELEPNRIMSVEDLHTQLAVLESTKIADRVAKRLSDEERSLFSGDASTDAAAAEIHKMVSVVPRRMSLIVMISASHTNRRLSAIVANYYAEECIEMNLESNVRGSRHAFNELVILRNEERDSIAQLERDLAEYRENHNMVSIDRREDIIREQLISLNEARVVAQNKHDQAKLRWMTVQQYLEENKDLTHLPFFNEDWEIVQHRRAISEIGIELATLSERYRAKHPVVLELSARLAGHEKELDTVTLGLIEGIEAAYLLTEVEHKQASTRLSQKKQDLIKLSKLRVEYDSLSRELTVQNAFLDALNSRMIEERAQVDLKKQNARIIERAALPIGPSSPNIKLGISVGFVVSLFGGISVAGLATFLDGRVKSLDTLERLFKVQSLGIIPRIDQPSSALYNRITQNEYHSGILEVFHSIRSGMHINSKIENPKVMLVSSTVPQEGKSFVSLNLADIYARHSERTLLIDCDLRMPVVATRLSLHEGLGLSDYIKSGEVDNCDSIIQTVYPNLDVIAAGEQKLKDPSTLFSSAKFQALISSLRGKYDRILIDSPPLSVVSDALNILPLSDGLLYVVKHNSVSHVMLNSVLKTLQESDLPIVGFVVNGMDAKLMKLYNYKYAYSSVSEAYGAKVCEGA